VLGLQQVRTFEQGRQVDDSAVVDQAQEVAAIVLEEMVPTEQRCSWED
jgi:hypothetical protein